MVTILVTMKQKIELDTIPLLMTVVSPQITGIHMVGINHITEVLLRRQYQMMNSTEYNGITKKNKKDDRFNP